ncbi:MAG TPA: O-antigen ligase family protein [Actinomycetota bacterium]|nr:O-antigen ligase family protein [Actinomycetota bacterium]
MTTYSPHAASRRTRLPTWRAVATALAWGTAVILVGTAVAYLVAEGRWYLALGLLASVPLMILIFRQPLATIALWALVTPFVSVTDVASVRQVFWLVHRGLPLVVLLVIVLGSISGVDERRLPRLGWPELLMAGYVVASLLSIAYTSGDGLATGYLLYERVVVPMCLYLIVRLLQPSWNDVRRMVPVAMFVLVTQSVVGILSWVVPGVLPRMWLSHVGERTVGTFGDPDVFGTTMLVCGWLILHVGLSTSFRTRDRVWPVLGFSLAMLMTFLTFSRGNWLAGLVVLAGALWLYRRFARLVIGVAVGVAVLLLASGVLTEQLEFAQRRLASEKSEEAALSRLPVAVAGIRMFEEKPLVGWGYGNFDLYSRRYQTRVADLVSAEKPHSSHNLFLSILAEQGALGFALFMGPMMLWFLRFRSIAPNMLSAQRTFVAGLWLLIAAYVLVNNFSVMRAPFGLGLWWLALGAVAAAVSRAQLNTDPRGAEAP